MDFHQRIETVQNFQYLFVGPRIVYAERAKDNLPFEFVKNFRKLLANRDSEDRSKVAVQDCHNAGRRACLVKIELVQALQCALRNGKRPIVREVDNTTAKIGACGGDDFWYKNLEPEIQKELRLIWQQRLVIEQPQYALIFLEHDCRTAGCCEQEGRNVV